MRAVRNNAGLIERPVAKEGLAVNIFLRDEAPDARIAGMVAVIAHDKIIVVFDNNGGLGGGGAVQVFFQIGFVQDLVIDEDTPVADFDGFTGKPDDPFDITIVGVIGIPKDNDITACEVRQAIVNHLVDKDAFAIVEARQHRSAFDLDRLHREHYQ